MAKDSVPIKRRCAKKTPCGGGPGADAESSESTAPGGDPQNCALMRTVLDSLTYPFYVIDVADYRVRLANRAAQEAFTQGAATCHALTHRRDLPCDTKEHPCPIEIIRKTGKPTVVEHVHYTPPGEARTVEVHAFPIRDRAGKLTQIIEYCVDTTERRCAEDAVRQSEERFRSLFENMLDGFAYCRMLYEKGLAQDFVYLDVNRAFVRLTGLKDVVGRKVSEVIPGLRETNPELFQIYGRVALTGTPEGFETYVEPLGIWFSVSVYSPRKEHFVAVFDNITDRKRAEQSLRDTHERLQKQAEELRGANEELIAQSEELRGANERLRELTATLETRVSQRTAELQHRALQLQRLAMDLSQAEDRERKHLAEILHNDLQQVLAAARFHVGVLRSRARKDPGQQAAAAQVEDLLNEAIEKSRSLSHELNPAVLSQGDLAATLAWLAGQVQAKHGLTVQVVAGGPVQSDSEGLLTFLYRAAQEMLFNVVKHAQVSRARMRVRRLGRCLCLSVSDQGRGFDPQQLKAVAGLGLLSIRERVELLGGRMKIKSAKGRGSTFRIVVPAGAPTPSSRGAAS